MSRPSEPVGIVSISPAFCPLSRVIEPLPKARSIWDRAASSALVLSTEVPSTTRRFGWLTGEESFWHGRRNRRNLRRNRWQKCTCFVPICKFFFVRGSVCPRDCDDGGRAISPIPSRALHLQPKFRV